MNWTYVHIYGLMGGYWSTHVNLVAAVMGRMADSGWGDAESRIENVDTRARERMLMDETSVTVRGARSVGPDTLAIDFETPPGFEAEPGQFVQLLADLDGTEVARFYTLSSPSIDDTFEVTVAIDPEGEFGPHLADLEPGDTIRVKGPFGDSYYRGEDQVVVLAGGPGIGPAVAIGERTLLEGGDVAVVYQDDGLVHEARLSTLADQGAAVFVVTDAFQAGVSGALATVPGAVFVFGFAEFVEQSKNALVAAGFDLDDGHFESFGPAP